MKAKSAGVNHLRGFNWVLCIGITSGLKPERALLVAPQQVSRLRVDSWLIEKTSSQGINDYDFPPKNLGMRRFLPTEHDEKPNKINAGFAKTGC